MRRDKFYYRILLVLIALLLLSIISLGIGVGFGSVAVRVSQIAQLFFVKHDLILYDIIVRIRLPRVLAAFTTGGLLALSGALMQVLLRNPLADPYVLGISGGGAVATLLVMLFGISVGFLNLWAFIGSLISMLLVMRLARSRRNFSSLRLLLTGVVIATGWSAIISFILVISPQNNLRGMLFWLMGDLSYASFSVWYLLILFFGLIISFVLAKPLNILPRGEITAKSLGINTSRLNGWLYIITSLLTACAVSIAGCIGFVGLLVPHMLRQVCGNDHRIILPGSVLLGGSLLTLADTLSRSLLAPTQLPVGVVTAMFGVPVFLFLLRRNSR